MYRHCIVTPHGRVVRSFNPLPDEPVWRYEYELKDHLGAVRTGFTDDGYGNPQIIQQFTYYPFNMKVAGMCWQTSSSKFIGKDREEIDEMDLDWIYWEKRFLEK